MVACVVRVDRLVYSRRSFSKLPLLDRFELSQPPERAGVRLKSSFALPRQKTIGLWVAGSMLGICRTARRTRI